MRQSKLKVKRILHKLISISLSTILVFLCVNYGTAAVNETPQAVYLGISNASALINNMNYTDVKSAAANIKEAVYEAGALNIVKSYGARTYGLKNSVSKEDALGLIYRAVGREVEAQKAGETINNAKAKADRKTSAVSIWADGYIQLATNDGLLSQQDQTDAFETDQTAVAADGFHRTAAVTRQEFAYWLAKVLEKASILQPVYGQQTIFNSYNDWGKVDSEKIPYLEAILENNIMNGDGKGNFSPSKPVTREQAALIMKNAEGIILPLLKMKKNVGTIEDKTSSKGVTKEDTTTVTSFNVRNSNGMLDLINTVKVTGSTNSTANENNGSSLASTNKEIIVYKNGALGNSSLLKTGDRIEYITADDNTVKFVKVISSIYNTKYIVAQIKSIDTSKRLLDVFEVYSLDYPDIDLAKKVTFIGTGGKTDVMYNFSNNISVILDNKRATIQDVKPTTDVILTIVNGVVTEIKNFQMNPEGEDVVSGIVEENNPEMGYIALYKQDGTGTGVKPAQQLYVLRIYNYGDQKEVEAFKNHNKAALEDIEPGDTVFLKLDDKGYISSMSAADNYTVKYAKVISKKPASISVEYEDGVQQILNVGKDVFVVQDNKPVSYARLKDGDRVRLMLNITPNATQLKEIAIEGDEHYISNVYKGRIASINDMNDKIVVNNLQVFSNGKWVRTEQKGSQSLRLADSYNMYFNNGKIDVNKANKYFADNEAYIAVEKDYGGEERAVIVSFRNQDDKEDTPYNDSIENTISGTGEFSLSKTPNIIKYGNGTIIIKDGRLVTGSSIANDDAAYVVANRSYDDGSYNAGIVKIDTRFDINALQIYRGRISKINDNTNFTVESFSRLKGQSWEYANTPKTFALSYDTIIMDTAGIVNQRDFIDYGAGSFKDKTVYVVTDGANVLLVSTAPYGIYNAKGEIFDVTGATYGDEGTLLTEPTSINLVKAKLYDNTSHLWTDTKDITINILANSVIIKDNKIIAPSELKKGDSIRVIKKDDTATGDAYIIFVGN